MKNMSENTWGPYENVLMKAHMYRTTKITTILFFEKRKGSNLLRKISAQIRLTRVATKQLTECSCCCVGSFHDNVARTGTMTGHRHK